MQALNLTKAEAMIIYGLAISEISLLENDDEISNDVKNTIIENLKSILKKFEEI